MSTRETFNIHRALVVRHRDNVLYVSILYTSGPRVEIGAHYPYPPPAPGSYVWLAATQSFDKFFVITEPVSILRALVQELRSSEVNSITTDDLELAVNTLLGGAQ
jgi:hypothetical protein